MHGFASNFESRPVGEWQSRSCRAPTACARQRERVLEAMLKVAAAKGYEATTVADVVEVAGVSEQAFAEMFEGKEACFLEAYDAVFDVLVAHVGSAFEAAAGEPWPERIAAGLGALVELLAAEADIARIAMVEVTAAGDDARARYRAALGRFTPFLEEGRAYSSQGRSCPPTPPASRSAAPPR